MPCRNIVFFSLCLILIGIYCEKERCAGPMGELPVPIIHDIPMERLFPDVAEMVEEEWFIKKNCTLEAPILMPPGATAIAVLASGSSCEGEWPLLEISIENRIIGSLRVCSSDWGWYTIPVDEILGGNELRITFSNDRYTGHEDINVHIRKVVFLGV